MDQVKHRWGLTNCSLHFLICLMWLCVIVLWQSQRTLTDIDFTTQRNQYREHFKMSTCLRSSQCLYFMIFSSATLYVVFCCLSRYWDCKLFENIPLNAKKGNQLVWFVSPRVFVCVTALKWITGNLWRNAEEQDIVSMTMLNKRLWSCKNTT